ncbi:MAG: DUF2332 family protein [Myxococcota bacterium]|nr:DUF2332 family protein [Myxococcota bacterium]
MAHRRPPASVIPSQAPQRAGRHQRGSSTTGRATRSGASWRCAGLLGGFLTLARETALPLRLREIGCSTGLNLHWDRYHCALGAHRWGETRSPVRIAAEWEGGEVPATTELRLRLWPGGEERLLATSNPHARRVEWLGL